VSISSADVRSLVLAADHFAAEKTNSLFSQYCTMPSLVTHAHGKPCKARWVACEGSQRAGGESPEMMSSAMTPAMVTALYRAFPAAAVEHVSLAATRVESQQIGRGE